MIKNPQSKADVVDNPLKLETISFIIEGTILMYFYNLSASTLLRVGRLHIYIGNFKHNILQQEG